MKHFIAVVILAIVFASPVSSQGVKDCSSCVNVEWNAEWNPATHACAGNPIAGCGNGCNCWQGFAAIITAVSGKATVRTDSFGGAFTDDGSFRIDKPGPLARNHVKAGDIAYRINGRKPRKSQLGTPKRPIRRAEATWDDKGRLFLRLLR